MFTDVVVIGGGPAGLTAAIYLARFHLGVTVIDRGGGRANSIPRTRNHSGFPDGITGADLVERMRTQAVNYGAINEIGEATAIERDGDGFVVWAAGSGYRCCAVLLATGAANNRPEMDLNDHDAALSRGLLRYCPICDGFEVTDQRVAVIGTGEHGSREANFLRSYTADVTLIAPSGPHDLNADQRQTLRDAGVDIVDGPCVNIEIGDDDIVLEVPSGRRHFATAYPALGSRIHSDLAKPLGVEMSDDGCMVVDRHQRTDIPGLYAAGDVVFGLDQISHAMGEGGVAATTIRNDLAERRPIRREARGQSPD
ncbi:NAD(P)/FAD-dependent oxidoreductase [Sphingomonas naphthae]|uniref:Thioredoxin reductase n=1 Tax=Sphingomonas naphthae TaxID=1813468 RepID=A0ABY7THF6_9SPHN|nr:NAD(P)/FAD-dependent oxidoreductase [Sphingomonas naphthae]WCT72648.1 NAD(P)/FAD-dependent oxidoreductase [Sphingomonas naphthae]